MKKVKIRGAEVKIIITDFEVESPDEVEHIDITDFYLDIEGDVITTVTWNGERYSAPMLGFDPEQLAIVMRLND